MFLSEIGRARHVAVIGAGAAGSVAAIFAAALLLAVIVERRPLADTVFARDQKHRLVVYQSDRHHVITLHRPNAPNPDGVAALVAQLVLMKTQTHAIGRDEDDLVVATR